jgi:hypothetical protein
MRQHFMIAGLVTASFLQSQVRSQAQTNYRSDRILVKPLSSEITNLHAAAGSRVLRAWPRFGNLQVIQISQGESVASTIARYRDSGLVQYAEPDFIYTIGDHNIPNPA